MNIGIIGTGNMGKILIDAFINSNAISENKLTVVNRTRAKAEKLKCKYPHIQVVNTPEEVVNNAEYIFLCVKPLEIHPLLKNLNSEIKENQCIISITSPISVRQLESILSCSVVRAIPSINNRVLSGTSLLTFGNNCSDHHREQIERLMEKISTPVIIEESITRIASDITSCGPAFFTYLLRQFIESAIEETEISREQATLLATKMLIGMGQLIEKEVFTLETLQEKVCVKGGITGEGIKVLEREVGDMFNQLIQSTHSKYEHEKEKIYEQFGINT
ncbi:late competence protein ComER [Bacillus sp. Marseille-P3661]|uniref:late competence protein ComER n=1 Tax=Bacillus sp. Marseille-P3661 TaxID=1936234 RepID=UPI000C861EDB|nr:late competence protein ComER [Bacillus sp. Marseille-P3661]